MRTEESLGPLNGERAVQALRFGPFELDLRSGELRRSGVLVHLQPQPSKVLELLALRAGELVTREEIQKELWPAGTFVDFEQSLNFCVRQIRSALGDSALSPRYLETLPRRGYRWIGPSESMAGGQRAAPLVPIGTVGGAGERTGLFASRVTTPETATYRHRRWLVATATALAVTGLGVIAYLTLQRGPSPVPRFRRLTFSRGFVESARFTSDGNVVYGASWEGQPPALFTAEVESRNSRRLDGPGGRLVGISRSGEAAFIKEGTLVRAPLAGGPAKEVLDNVVQADWLPDGSDFAVVRYSLGPGRIEFPIGTVLCEALSPSHIRIAPNGERVAFLEHPIFWDDRGYVTVVDRAGKATRLSGPWGSIEGLAWSPRGNEVWFTATRAGSDSALYAVDLGGHERPLAPAMGRLILHDVSRDGRALIERATVRMESRFRSEDDTDERDLSWLDYTSVSDLSPDGRLLLFGESGEGGGPDYTVFVRRTDGSPPVRIGPGRPMGLSADAKWVLTIPLKDPSHIDLLPTGPGEARTIKDEGIAEYEMAGWHPDGRSFFFTGREKGSGQRRTYLRGLEEAKPRPVTPPGVALWKYALTSDGRSLVGGCKAGLCLYPLEGGEPQPLPNTERGSSPVGVDSRGRLYVRKGSKEKGVATILRLDLNTGKSTTWKELGPKDRTGFVGVGSITVSRDGRSYAYSSARILSDLHVAEDVR
ncbi:MAG TPA: winged helix-turn-helix domain-containing protein [Vicinamibacteria bacterium]|nr:winged helix-turn-helix domain-containing protein [Vicinamibacteria bacterium]